MLLSGLNILKFVISCLIQFLLSGAINIKLSFVERVCVFTLEITLWVKFQNVDLFVCEIPNDARGRFLCMKFQNVDIFVHEIPK